MASTAQFQLFPPPPPRVNPNTNPFRRGGKKHPTRPRPISPVIEDIVKRSSQTEAVIIQIIEDTSSVQVPPQAHVVQARSRTPSPEPIVHQKPIPAPLTIKTSSKPASPVDQSARSGSATLVRTPSVRSQPRSPRSPRSPVVAMRSMFPRYDPTKPLDRQQYYPTRGASPTNLPMQSVQRGEYSPHATSPSRLDEVLGGPKTAPASVIDFPVDILSPQGPKLSTQLELDALWESTNGQGPQALLGTFEMEMSRTEPATFSFGPSAQEPFYTLQTYDTNELAITRTHPLKPNVQVPILLLALEPEARRHAPADGLVSFIFPKLAAILAIDQSIELAKQHQLAPTVRDEMQADAVQRAANQESCRLVWKDDCRRYELAHPAIGKSVNRSPRIGTPISAAGEEWGVLHITVSTHALTSPFSTAASPPVILVTNPNPTPATVAHAPATPRTSTLPVSETDEPLASLDLGSMTLKISAGLITTLLPSLFAIDSVVAAMMAVAVADEATNPIMAEMPLWSPPRRYGLLPPAPASVFGGSVAGSYTGDLFATLAEREEAEEEAKMMSQIQKSKSTASKKSVKKAAKKSKKAEPKQIVIGEFDLEKYGHYQSGDREGEKLPGVTRSAIKMMYLALKFVVWILTVLVQLLTWTLVGVTRAVTSEKF